MIDVLTRTKYERNTFEAALILLGHLEAVKAIKRAIAAGEDIELPELYELLGIKV